MAQRIYTELTSLLAELAGKKPMLICGNSFDRLSIAGKIPEMVQFREFSPNPKYEDVCKAVELFRASGCDCLLAVGGGSAMDVAKCVKLFAPMDAQTNYLTQPYEDSGILLAAIPTTAGTGSESTRHAVIYYQGEKQSISHPALVPDVACLIPEVLEKLPIYQKKCTLLDALCQAIESWWSVSATQESIAYSRKAIAGIRDHWESYLAGDKAAAAEILLAANFAGRAINITATTAAHAMSYKLTSLYGIPHGHAVALAMEQVWAEMTGETALETVFAELPVDRDWFRELLKHLEMTYPEANDRAAELDILADSVNPLRLKNNPVPFSRVQLKAMYERILK